MASSNNEQVISLVRPHTVKKFELIESYVETWAQKLLNTPKCEGTVLSTVCVTVVSTKTKKVRRYMEHRFVLHESFEMQQVSIPVSRFTFT